MTRIIVLCAYDALDRYNLIGFEILLRKKSNNTFDEKLWTLFVVLNLLKLIYYVCIGYVQIFTTVFKQRDSILFSFRIALIVWSKKAVKYYNDEIDNRLNAGNFCVEEGKIRSTPFIAKKKQQIMLVFSFLGV